MAREMRDLIDKLGSKGGCIVSSADCHESEIEEAKLRGDFFVDSYTNLGYVRRLHDWLAKNSDYARKDL